MASAREKWAYLSLGVVLLVALLLALRPAAQPVDVATVTYGTLDVSVDDDGVTRAHDHYVVTAPVAGRLLRIDLHDGDAVAAGTVVAQLAPLPLGIRECAEQHARLASAQAAEREATELLRHVQSDYEQAQRESARLQSLVARKLVAEQSAEQARNAELTTRHELAAARQRAAASHADVQLAEAGLLAADACRSKGVEALAIRAPVAGQILRIEEKSERVLPAGAPLMVLGDPARLEVVVDVVSSAAVQVAPGMPAEILNWGGERPLRATVRTVEPYAFTKISALGVEEQRVNVILDLQETPARLGDGYRVDARIIVWHGEHVLAVPVGALFRHGAGMAVFVVEHDRARLRTVMTGHRNASDAEVLTGLAAAQQVVLYPSNTLRDGSRVRPLPPAP